MIGGRAENKFYQEYPMRRAYIELVIFRILMKIFLIVSGKEAVEEISLK